MAVSGEVNTLRRFIALLPKTNRSAANETSADGFRRSADVRAHNKLELCQ